MNSDRLNVLQLKQELFELKETIKKLTNSATMFEKRLEEIWENQRRVPFPYSKFSTKDLFPGERGPWTDSKVQLIERIVHNF